MNWQTLMVVGLIVLAFIAGVSVVVQVSFLWQIAHAAAHWNFQPTPTP